LRLDVVSVKARQGHGASPVSRSEIR